MLFTLESAIANIQESCDEEFFKDLVKEHFYAVGVAQGCTAPSGVEQFLKIWDQKDRSGKKYAVIPGVFDDRRFYTSDSTVYQFNGMVSYDGEGKKPERGFWDWICGSNEHVDLYFTISLRPVETFDQDEWIKESSPVQSLIDKGLCYVTARRCVESYATRTIKSIPIQRPCWRYIIDYTCQLNRPSTCKPLKDKGCLQTHKRCREEVAGKCLLWEKTYACQEFERCLKKTTVQGNPPLFCLEGNCVDQTWEPNRNMGKALSQLAVLQEIQKQIDPNTLHVFPGRADCCATYPLNFKDCCSSFGHQCHGHQCPGHQCPGWGEAGAAGMAGLIGKVAIVGPVGWVVGGAAGALAATVDICSAAEKQLAKVRQEGKTIFIGTYCAITGPFGVCLQTKSTYCVFGSALARLVNEEGAKQLKKGFGTPENPCCTGLSTQELGQVDLSLVDLSEVLNVHPPNVSETPLSEENIKKHIDELQRRWKGKLPAAKKTTMENEIRARQSVIGPTKETFSLHEKAKQAPEGLDLAEKIEALKQKGNPIQEIKQEERGGISF